MVINYEKKVTIKTNSSPISPISIRSKRKTPTLYVVSPIFSCKNLLFPQKNINILNINWLQKNMFFNTKKL